MQNKISQLWSGFLKSELYKQKCKAKRKPKNRELTPEEKKRNKLASSLRGVNSRPSEITTEGKLLLMWKSGFVEVGKVGLLIEVLKEHLLGTTGEIEMEHLENIVSDFQNRQSQTYCKCGGIVAEHCDVCLECK